MFSPGRARHRTRAVKNFLLLSILCLTAALGCRRQPTVLGQKPDSIPVVIASISARTNSPSLTVRGQIIEKCPVAGCWFYLRDQTGTIKVDTKASRFVVVKIPLGTTVVVSGKIISEGSGRILEASGLEY